MAREIEFVFNGNPLKMMIADHWTLLHLIREELGYTGTKEGCGSGEKLPTSEGLADADGHLHPIRKSFVENGGIQCGFCSPGMIMSAKALLDKTPNAPEEEIKEAIAGNLCRCTGYVQIIDSIKAVSGHGEDEPQVVAFKTDERDRGE